MMESTSELDAECSAIAEVMNALHSTKFSERFWFDVLSNHVRICIRRKEALTRNKLDNAVPLEDFDGTRIPEDKAVRQRDWLIVARSLARIRTGRTSPKLAMGIENVLIGERLSKLSIANSATWFPRCPLPILRGYKVRKKLREMAGEEPDTFRKNLLLQIPRLYVEYLGRILDQLCLSKNATQLTFHVEHADVFTKISLAYFREKGSRIVNYQLGGMFGEVEGHPPGGFYQRIEVLKTYGWSIHKKDDPFYGVRLEEFADKYRREQAGEDVDLLVIYNRLKGKRKAHYEETTTYLGANVDRIKFPRVMLRPRGASRKVSNKSQLNFLNSRISANIDSGMESLSSLCAKSGVVVHLEHPSTNFLECVFVDQPIVALQTNSSPTKLVRPYYEFFIDNGVMHPTIQSMVHHLNSVDITTWWEKVVGTDDYQRFKFLFARSKSQYEGE